MKVVAQWKKKLAKESWVAGIVLNMGLWISVMIVSGIIIHQNITQNRPVDSFLVGAIAVGIVIIMTMVYAIQGVPYIWLIFVALIALVASLVLWFLSLGVLKEYDLFGSACILIVLSAATAGFSAIGNLKPNMI